MTQLLPRVSTNILNWITVTQAIGSLAISVLVFFVYLRLSNIQRIQTNILNRQAELMEKQAEIMAAEFRPDITGAFSEVSNEHLRFNVSNSGNGQAKNLTLINYLYRKKKDSDYYSPAFGSQLAGWGFAVLPISSEIIKTSPDTDSKVDSIDSDTVGETFEARMKFVISPLFTDTRYEASFEEVMERVCKEWTEVDELAIESYIWYRDEVNEFGYSRLGTFTRIPVREGITLEEAYKSGVQSTIPMSQLVPNPSMAEEPSGIFEDGIDWERGVLHPDEKEASPKDR